MVVYGSPMAPSPYLCPTNKTPNSTDFEPVELSLSSSIFELPLPFCIHDLPWIVFPLTLPSNLLHDALYTRHSVTAMNRHGLSSSLG